MERRDRSLKALKELVYIDSLDDYDRAPAIARWVEKYLNENISDSFDLELKELENLSELFYKNINFLKEHKTEVKKQLDNGKKLKSFFN